MGRDHPHLLLHEYFKECARGVPQEIALYEGDRSITFSELESRAMQLAGALRSLGVQRGSSIGLHLERSIDWVVGLLAILEANAAVVPLSPSHPVGWLREILSFADLDAVIDDEKTPLDPSLTRRVMSMAELSSVTGAPPEVSAGNPDQSALVLCSSGSTGRPKMIVRSHRSFFHRLRWTWEKHPFSAGEVCCQKAHMTTTHAIYELFEPLLSGTPVVIIPDPDVRDLELFWDTIRTRRVSRLLMVPSALRASLDMPGFAPPPLDVLVLMGEYVPPGLAEETVAAFPALTRIYSIYGSTEASSTLVCDLRESLRPGAELPLGKPISPDVRALVLGSDLEPVPPGQPGRLYMSGPPLFTEYFRDPALTDSVFVDVPGHSERLYDTHDQVRPTAHGDLQFLGRVDHTIKVRGFRVDLAEVERAILLHPDVSQATVVVTGGDAGGSLLVAFVTPASVDRTHLFQMLRGRLPDYAVPSVLVGLDSFPLTVRGKVDRARLLEDYAAQAPAPPLDRELSETEGKVREVWERTLGHENFRHDDSFFEVGGTSLTTFALVNGLRRAFGFQRSQLPEQTVYRAPTLEAFAGWIDDLLAGRSNNAPQRTPLLVTLRKGSDPSKEPFFLIASAGGTLGAYEKLAKALKTPREIIGVRDPFTWGERDPTEGFQSWISLYLDAIRQRQPQGPYYVGAYSSAGAFGYEIACRLRQEGQEVAQLVLIDPLALDRSSRRRFGWWALRATWMRPPFRALVRLWGWLRVPALRILRAVRPAEVENDLTLSAERFRQIAEGATRSKGHLLNVSALLELNTGLPFALTEEDFSELPPDQYLGVLQSRVGSLTPDVEAARIEAISIQYELQLAAQHAYELGRFDGPVVLVEPATRYAGILQGLFRAHVRNLRVRAVKIGPPSGRTRAISERLGALEAHYRSMRDDVFVEGLAKELDIWLG